MNMSKKKRISAALRCLAAVCMVLLAAAVIFELYGKYVCTTTWVAAGSPCLCEHFGTLFWARIFGLSGMCLVLIGADALVDSKQIQSTPEKQSD